MTVNNNSGLNDMTAHRKHNNSDSLFQYGTVNREMI